jgi:MerR family transcriptional regulator/heat shock protein HspR
VNPARTGGGSRRYSQSDIDRLCRIQELTNEGLNLAGVQRVLALEHRIRQLEGELAATRVAATEAVADAHRQYRRELVPVPSGSVVLYGEGRRPRR